MRLNGELAVAPGGANRILVEHQPIGVAVMVTPWNFPAAMATRKIAPGARRRLHLRPEAGHRDAASPPTSLAGLFAEAGVPAGVVNVLTTSRSGATVSAMLHDPRVRKLSFTGSTEVGRTPAQGGRRPGAATARWSSAATRPSSSSTTPTSRRRSTGR